MDVRVTPQLSWHPHHEWNPGSGHVDGELSDGRQVDVITHAHSADVTGTVRVAATHEWLHDHVVVLDNGDGTPPRVVVPVNHLTGACVGEALRRWLRHDTA